MKCWNCGKTSHIKKHCRALKKNEENKRDVATAITEKIHNVLLLSIDNSIDCWVLDSGALFHTTTYSKFMENYAFGNYVKMYLVDDEPLDIVSVGDIRLKMSNNYLWKIHKVRHVLKLMCNLISVGQFDDEGHNVTFSSSVWKVTKCAMVVARGNNIRTMCMTSNCLDMVYVVDSNANSDSCHCRLRHMSEKGMKVLISNGKLLGLKFVEHKLHGDCIFGK